VSTPPLRQHVPQPEDVLALIASTRLLPCNRRTSFHLKIYTVRVREAIIIISLLSFMHAFSSSSSSYAQFSHFLPLFIDVMWGQKGEKKGRRGGL